MVGGLLLYNMIRRQVRLYLLTQDQQVPAMRGETATPAAAAVFALFTRVALVHVRMGHRAVLPVYGVEPHH
jgi:succinate dehydrogenase hydrophobic anchor subunit